MLIRVATYIMHYCVQGIVLSMSHIRSHLILTTALGQKSRALTNEARRAKVGSTATQLERERAGIRLQALYLFKLDSLPNSL